MGDVVGKDYLIYFLLFNFLFIKKSLGQNEFKLRELLF